MSKLEHTQKSNIPMISAEQHHRMVAEAAYYLAERRGFQEGKCMTDWLQAEIDVERMLEAPTPKTPAKRKPRTTTPKTNAKNNQEAL
jgi:Protein of unknown function (DUF2934).